MDLKNAAPTDFLRSILESPKGVVIFSLDKNYQYTTFSESHKAEIKTIWNVEIAVGVSVLAVILNEVDREKAKANFDRALQGESFVLIEEYGDVDHQRIFYENRYAPVKDDEGKIIGVSVFVIDVSELKQVENALKLSKQRLRLVLKSIPDSIFRINTDGTYLDSLTELSNGDPSPLLGKNISDKLSPKISLQYKRAIKQCLYLQTIQTLDYEILNNGLQQTLEARFIPFSQEEVLVLVRDITSQKRTELEILKLSLIAEHTVNAVIITDASGNIEWVNEAFTRITEYSLPDVIGKKPGSVLQKEESDPVLCAYMREKIKAKLPFIVEIINYTKSGRKYWVHINAQPIFEHTGLVTKFFAIETDITERKMAEIKIVEQNTRLTSITENLTRKNEQLEEFTQIVSHNLRSPIGNISALIEHLHSTQDESERLDIINHLKLSTKSIMLTLNELNDVLKIKYAGHIVREVIDLQKVYEKVKGMLLLQINEIKADVTADFKNAPIILYPPIYIESVILNLLSNALKYFSPDRKTLIHFESWIENNSVMMSVNDTGSGIDLERYGHQVFKLRKTFHRHSESRGVGLFLIKNQIETMGGEITISSEVNMGTTFIINFGIDSYEK